MKKSSIHDLTGPGTMWTVSQWEVRAWRSTRQKQTCIAFPLIPIPPPPPQSIECLYSTAFPLNFRLITTKKKSSVNKQNSNTINFFQIYFLFVYAKPLQILCGTEQGLIWLSLIWLSAPPPPLSSLVLPLLSPQWTCFRTVNQKHDLISMKLKIMNNFNNSNSVQLWCSNDKHMCILQIVPISVKTMYTLTENFTAYIYLLISSQLTVSTITTMFLC